MGELAEGGATTKVSDVDGRAERVERELIEEGFTVVDIARLNGISGEPEEAGVLGVRATHRPWVVFCICDPVKVGNNIRSGVISEIIFVNLVLSATILDVRNSSLGHPSGFPDAGDNEEHFFLIITVDLSALLEIEFALGDVGDGDGDGTGFSDVGRGDIGDGHNVAFEPDDLER